MSIFSLILLAFVLILSKAYRNEQTILNQIREKYATTFPNAIYLLTNKVMEKDGIIDYLTQNANLAGAAGELHEALCLSMYREKILRNPHGALMAIADACVEDIISMTDQEIEDELRGMGLDPAEEAAKVRKIFEDTIQKFKAGRSACGGSGVEG